MPLRGVKMAKNANVGNFLAHFLLFLSTLQVLNHYDTIFSCRGGSKLQFDGSYVKNWFRIGFRNAFFI